MCLSRRYRGLSLAVAVCLPLTVSGCITFTSSDDGYTSLSPSQKAALQGVQQALTVTDIRNSFLFKSADIFYPDGMPADPSQLPMLNANQLHTLEEFVSAASDRVAKDARRFQDVLSQIYGRKLPAMRITRIALEQGDIVEARVDVQGTLYVSANVIQAIYRGVLLDSLEENQEVPNDATGRQQQEIAAFKAFDEVRTRLKSMSLATPVNEIEHALEGAEQTSGNAEDKTLGALENMLVGELEDYIFIQRSQELSGAFFDAMVFVAGHELGHLELGQLPLEPAADICAEIGQHEFDADRFSAILLALDQYHDRTVEFSEGEHGTEEHISPDKYISPGYQPFFKYAYEFAGFNDIRRPGDCVPPSAEQREAQSRAQYYMAAEVLQGAALDRGLMFPWWLRMFGLQYSEEVTADPETDFDATYQELQTFTVVDPNVESQNKGYAPDFSSDDLAAAKTELKALFFYKFDP